MQNFALLRRLATVKKPILLNAALGHRERVAARRRIPAFRGNDQVALCERGIKTFETATRNTFDLAAVALAKELSHLPVVADPSHGTGKQSLIVRSRARPSPSVPMPSSSRSIAVRNARSPTDPVLDLPQFERVMRGLSDPLRPVLSPNPGRS